MNRADLQELARIRLNESDLLLKSGAFDGAYYLAGYAIECGLKACIAKKTKRYDFPDKKLVEDSYVHEPVRLVRAAGLASKLEQHARQSVEFRRNWATVKDWSEKARYERKSKQQAEALYQAVADPTDGVWPWLQKHW